MSEAKRFFQPGSRRTKEFLLAKTMMVLVLVFLILNSPRIILGVFEVTLLKAVEQCYENGLEYHMSKQAYIFDFLARSLVILNSSVNFLIYCLVGSEFRTNLCKKLGIRRSIQLGVFNRYCYNPTQNPHNLTQVEVRHNYQTLPIPPTYTNYPG